MPIVGIPDRFIIDCIFAVGRVLRDDLFACEIAFSVIQASFVSEPETSDHTLCRTQCRLRYEVLFSIEVWTNLGKKILFPCINGKRGSGNTTVFLRHRYLMNELEITRLTDDIGDGWLIGRMHRDTAMIAVSLVELLSVSESVSLFMALIRVFTRKRESVLDVESKFLLDDLERFSSDLTLQDPSDEGIDIFLSGFVTDYFFVIFSCCEGLDKRPMIRRRLFLSFPFPSFFLHFLFCHGIVFVGDRFIIAERGHLMREEFAPFSGASHMIDYFPGDFFVFFH